MSSTRIRGSSHGPGTLIAVSGSVRPVRVFVQRTVVSHAARTEVHPGGYRVGFSLRLGCGNVLISIEQDGEAS
jgi:hypothetical protein